MSTEFELPAIVDSPDSELDSNREEAPEGLPREPDQPRQIPALSVVIPVRNDPDNLELCLKALAASEYADYEIIVVDDASTDSTPEVARRHGARLLHLDSRSGPAKARNYGAQEARFPFLFFVDADVCVRPGTLGQVAAQFYDSPELDAFFGSYDADPGAPGVVSTFRNLLHHFVHQSANEKATTFWSGCGAIKRSVFLDLGGFDTRYSNASIEDIELGTRLRRAGHRLELIKGLQVKHMKRWTLGLMIRTDIRNRAIPWTQLLLRQGKIPNDLNLRHSQRLSALLALGLIPTLIFAPLLAPAMLAGIVLLNRGFYAFLSRAKSPFFALRSLPLHVLYYLYSSFAFGVGLLIFLGRRPR